MEKIKFYINKNNKLTYSFNNIKYFNKSLSDTNKSIKSFNISRFICEVHVENLNKIEISIQYKNINTYEPFGISLDKYLNK